MGAAYLRTSSFSISDCSSRIRGFETRMARMYSCSRNRCKIWDLFETQTADANLLLTMQ